MYAAIIVETRSLDKLPEIIRGHMRFLKGWDLHIFGNTNEGFLERNLSNFTFHNVGDITIDRYNRLLTSPGFWAMFKDYERVLIFQHDSMILREGVEEFLKWDYIGAEWYWNKNHCGNGGLSLRNPAVMEHICKSFTWNGLNEDHYLTDIMYRRKIGNLAPLSEAAKFSTETVFRLGTWGYHAIDNYFDEKQLTLIKNYVPV